MKAPFCKGHFYHIYNRGCNKQNIFFKESYIKYGANVIAYCLMPNHYHFLIEQITERPLSDWIQMLFNGYVQAINKQENRTGTLFEGTAKHIDIEDEVYLIHLIRYIHYNPVEANLAVNAQDWKYSNYPEWIGVRKGSLIDREFAMRYFPKPGEYREFVTDYTIDKKLNNGLKLYLLDD